MQPAEWWSFTAASAVLWWMYGMKAEWSAGFEVRKTGTEWRWNGMHWPKAHWYNKCYMFCFRHNWWVVGKICGLNWRYARKLTEGVNTFCSAFRRLTYFRGKYSAEKENRPLESVGKGKGWQRKESTKMGGYCLCELLLCGSRKVKTAKSATFAR